MRNGKEKWKRLRNRQFACFYTMAFSFGIALLILISLGIMLHKNNLIMDIIVIGIIGIMCIALGYSKLRKTKRISKLMETFIRSGARI